MQPVPIYYCTHNFSNAGKSLTENISLEISKEGFGKRLFGTKGVQGIVQKKRLDNLSHLLRVLDSLVTLSK